jgi:hypothetical protein
MCLLSRKRIIDQYCRTTIAGIRVDYNSDVRMPKKVGITEGRI